MLSHLAPFDGQAPWAAWAKDVKGGLLVLKLTGSNAEQRQAASKLMSIIEDCWEVASEQVVRDAMAEATADTKMHDELLYHLLQQWTAG